MSKTESSAGMNPELLRFLKQPDTYTHRPSEVHHIQTHISHVFIAEPFVYKIKKPVDLNFLDYSTLEKRKYYCKREVELNRRLCSDTYLGVIPIILHNNSFRLENDDEGDIVEYAVKMKQLNDQYFLHRYIEKDQLTNEQLDRVIDKLSAFYLNQQPGDEVEQWGRIEKIKYNTDENFEQTKSFIGKTITENSYKAIQHYTNQYFSRFDSLFRERVEEKRIVDGHGDLHMEHIHIAPDKVRIYDCIEFNDRFRYGDVATDLAFLAMDLDFNHCMQEEHYFTEQMAKKLNDLQLLTHINFYKCYRAYVKGKVKSIQSTEEEVEQKDREKAETMSQNYFDLALRYALFGSQPTILILMGRIATGKTTLAEKLSESLNIDRLSSDYIRKSMMNLPLTQRTNASKRDALYSAQMSEKTYHALREKAKKYIEEQKCIILDATYGNPEQRADLVAFARESGAHYCFIETQATDDIIKDRLKLREEKDDVVSDARLGDFDTLSQHYAAPGELNSTRLIEIDTSNTLEQSMNRLYKDLIELHLKGTAENLSEIV